MSKMHINAIKLKFIIDYMFFSFKNQYKILHMENNIEITHVIDTYGIIANEFDKTRISIWKCVQQFISSIDKQSKILDVGCGNGKNIKFMLQNECKNVKGCDATPNFVTICRKQGFDVDEANIMNLPYVSCSFDNVICIAVIHHLSSNERRTHAISELLRVTKKGGRVLVTVSSLEEPFHKSGNIIGSNGQDLLIPWNTPTKDKIGDRYYHLFVKGELEKLCEGLEFSNIESFFEHGNWCVIITK